MKHMHFSSFYTKLTNFYVALAFCSVMTATIYSNSLFRLHASSFSSSDIRINWATSQKSAMPRGSLDLEVENGDTLSSLLQEAGVSKVDALSAIKALAPYHNLGDLRIGQKIALTFDVQDGAQSNSRNSNSLLAGLAIKITPEKMLHLVRTKSGSFTVTEKITPLTRRVAKIRGAIDGSFLGSAAELGIPSSVMMDLIKAYSYDVDFERDIQPGDKFEVLFERFYTPTGEFAHEGHALFSSLTLGNRKLAIYHHVTATGEEGYFTADGRSVRKDLLRTPVNVAHITSRFGMRRHPVLGYSKMHKGVDFAASTGTPILAAGTGVIEEIGRKSTYGNYIRIRHTAAYSTAYAHASRFAKLRKGDTVKQGDVIAYVGSTGRATGPHLHYEVLLHNQQTDPLKIKLSPGIQLAGAEWERFTYYKQTLATAFNNVPTQGELAWNSGAQSKTVN